MELTPMQYKGFVWPHNPRTYRISYRRRVAVHDVPRGRYTMQDMGLSHRVMEGEGEFFGPDAYDQFKALASVFYLGGPGALIHPVWQAPGTAGRNRRSRSATPGGSAPPARRDRTPTPGP